MLALPLAGVFLALTGAPDADARQSGAKKDLIQETFLTTLDPQVAALLRAASDAYMKMHSYRHTVVQNWRGETEEGVTEKSESCPFAIQRPNKFLYTCFDSSYVQVSDGRIFVDYLGNEYRKNPAPSAFNKVEIGQDAGWPNPQANSFVMLLFQGKMLQMLQGKLTWRSAHGEKQIPDFKPGPVVEEEGRQYQTILRVWSDTHQDTLYFDSGTHLIARMKQEFHDGGGKLTIIERFDNIEINRPIDESLFKFTPPDEATLVKEFTPLPKDDPQGVDR